MPSYTQYMRQMAVMDANDDDIESWITVKGNHIPIKKGQSKEDAVKSFIEKKGGSGKKETTVQSAMGAVWTGVKLEGKYHQFHKKEDAENFIKEAKAHGSKESDIELIGFGGEKKESAPKENESDLKKWDAEVTKYHDEEEKVEQQRKAIQSDLSKFSDVYNKLYKDSNAFAYNPKNLDAEFKKAGENSETFKEWVRSMAKERQDGFTSDRELRALLIVAKEKGLIPEKKTTSRKPDNHVYVDTKHPHVHYVDPKAWAAPANDPFSAYYD